MLVASSHGQCLPWTSASIHIQHRESLGNIIVNIHELGRENDMWDLDSTSMAHPMVLPPSQNIRTCLDFVVLENVPSSFKFLYFGIEGVVFNSLIFAMVNGKLAHQTYVIAPSHFRCVSVYSSSLFRWCSRDGRFGSWNQIRVPCREKHEPHALPGNCQARSSNEGLVLSKKNKYNVSVCLKEATATVHGLKLCHGEQPNFRPL